jgi:hypothetical protein
MVRPNLSVPFVDTNPQSLSFAKALEVETLRAGASGYMGTSKALSADGLTLTAVSLWESVAAHDSFVDANKNLILERKALRDAYFSDVGIVATLTKG